MIGTEDERMAAALQWITGILRERGVEFQAVGGLAARAHGATRPLVDLDFYIRGEKFGAVVAAAGDFRVWGPERYRDENWDLIFAKFDWNGVTIELGDAHGARYFDHTRKEWVPQNVDFRRSEEKRVLGVPVPVMPKAQLVAYKRGLDRAVDRVDLEELALPQTE